MLKSFKSMINREETPPISDKYRDFRKIIIELNPDAEGIKRTNELPNVWGALIEGSSRFPNLAIALMILATVLRCQGDRRFVFDEKAREN